MTFVVDYAPTEGAAEGQKTKYMATLNSTVASVPIWEHVFVLTNTNARTVKRDEGGEEADNKVLGAYGRDVLNANGKLLLGFTEGNKLALLNTLFCTPKSDASCTFQSANHSKGQARLDYILTKKVDRRPVRCVNVCRPPLEAPESDHNLVHAKVYIPRRSAPNQRRKENTKETPRTAKLWLITSPNLRCQVANAIIAALRPILDGTCISDIATETATELALRSKRPSGAQGCCAGPGVEAKMSAVWGQRGGEEARRRLRAELYNSDLQKTVNMAIKIFRRFGRLPC